MHQQIKGLRKSDPIKRNAQKQIHQLENSPMNPPDAFSPPCGEGVSYDQMPPFLQNLMDDHSSCLDELGAFEGILLQLQQRGLNHATGIQKGLKQFFSFLDTQIVRHHLKEEKILFPLLQEKLRETGEHSKGHYPKTAIDMLEDDHIKLMQLAAVTFNFLGLASRLPDARSRTLVLDAALEQGKALIELLRLHIFREDSVVFPLALKHIMKKEFDEMEKRISKFNHY